MKKYTFIILNFLILIVLSTACDKDEISGIQQEKFIKFYGFSDDDYGSDIIQLDNGSYALVGTITTELDGKNMCFIRTDEFGNGIAPLQLFGGRFDDYGTKIRLLSDGSFLLLGTRVDNITRDKNIYLVKITGEGEVSWERSFGSTADDEAFDMLVRNDGSIVLTGYSDSLAANGRDIMIAKVSANGQLQWLNLIGYNGDETGNSVIENNGGFMIVGTTNSRPVGTQVNNIILVKTNAFGTGFLPTTYASPGNTEGNFIEKTGNGFVILGTAYGSDDASSEFTMLHINNDLHVVSEANFGEGEFCAGKSIIIRGEDIIAFGTTQLGANSREISLVKTTISLDSFEYHYYGGNSLMEAGGITKTSDNGFVMTGVNKVNERGSIVMLKVNEQLAW